MTQNWQRPEIQRGSSIISSEVLQLIQQEDQLAGVGLLSQPDMGTLQFCCVKSESPEHVDPELYFVAMEWEEIRDVPVFEQLRDIFLDGHSGTDDLETEFGLFLDDCCLCCLDTLKSKKLDRISDSAIYVYSRLDATDDEYVEWFLQLNGNDYEPALRGVLGVAPAEPYKPRNRDETPSVLKQDEIEFVAAASCGKLATVEKLADGVSELVLAEAFVLAARTGRAEVCQYLLNRKVDPSHRGYMGKTALEFATQENRKRVIELLSNGDAQPSSRRAPDRPADLDRELLWILEVKIPEDRMKSQNK